MLTARWLRPAPTGAPHATSLICVPYAGGGPAAFRDWQRHATATRLVPVCLPGRENRLAEPALTDLGAIADAVLGEVRALDGGYALFGHSLGGLTVFELGRRIARAGLPGPSVVFIAGCAPPPFEKWTPIAHLPAAELLEHLRAMGGLPAGVHDYPELLELMLPTLRADLSIVDSYDPAGAEPLPFPIQVLYGTHDPYSGRAEAEAWRRYTTAGFGLSEHDGGHFFPFDDPAPVVRAIERRLAEPRSMP
jgi:medium-chain acyl-[acyl-carrier-protein] hydrolase